MKLWKILKCFKTSSEHKLFNIKLNECCRSQNADNNKDLIEQKKICGTEKQHRIAEEIRTY